MKKVSGGRVFALVLLALPLTLAAVWYSLGHLLASDRGLDFTDEGLHLLSADPPTPDAVWWTPWILQTKPLFALAAYDIATFRTLGATILVFSAALAGLVTSQATQAVSMERRVRWRAAAPLLTVLGAAITALAFYSWFLRTPNYDWLNLVGTLLTVTGAFGFTREQGILAGRQPTRIRKAAWLTLSAFGAVATLSGRPTTYFALLAAAAAIIALRCGLRVAAKCIAILAVLSLIFVGLALLSGLWPTNVASLAVSMFRDYAPFDTAQTISGALRDVMALPVTFVRETWLLPRPIKYPLLAGFALLVWMSMRRMRYRYLLLVMLPMAALLLMSVSSIQHKEVLDQATTAAGWFYLLTLVYVMTELRWAGDSKCDHPKVGRPPMVLLPISAVVVLLAATSGVGSINGTYAMASKSLVLVFLAAAILVHIHRQPRLVVAGLVFLVLAFGLLTAQLLKTGYQHPLNVATSMSDQGTLVAVGPRGSTLKLDPETAAYVAGLGRLSRDGCWKPGTKLLGAEWQWTTTDAYILGATTPPSLMLTILYPNDAALRNLDLSLTRVDPAAWRSAWIATTDPAHVPVDGRQTVQAALDRITGHLGTRFPADYELVSQVGGTQLWAPAGTVESCRR